MEPGLYIRFFSSRESADRELPAVGPLYNVVLRQTVLIAERRTVQQAQELGVSIDRWLEAELEMQRATGEESGGTKRISKRISARDGVLLRFAVFGDAREPDTSAELGPFASVVIGPQSVEADGRTLATRVASDLAPWQLTSGAGDELDGTHKPDIAFRTASTSYHPSITAYQARPRPDVPSSTPPPPIPSEPAFAIPPRSDSVFSPPTAAAEPFFAPPPRTEQVIRPTPLTEQVIRPATPTEQVIRPTPLTEQVIRPAPRAEPAAAPPADSGSLFVERPRKQTEVYAARGDSVAPVEEKKLTPEDNELIERLARERNDETLRARINEGERKRLGINEQAKEDAATASMRYRTQAAADPTYESESRFAWGPALWRMRFAIIGVLLLMAAGYAFIVLRTGSAPTISQGQQVTYVGIAQRFSGAHWDFIVNGVQRVPTAGAARARGLYYIVRIGATNKGADAQQLSPGDFSLIDANGTVYGPEGTSSGAYQGPDNASSPFTWPASFPSGKSVTFSVIFDVDPSLPRGMVLKMTDPAGIRVRLD
ncbi:MAG: hypothetical protein ABI888_02260 [Chloroflexota bacterium]